MTHLVRLIMLNVSSSINRDKIKIAKENNLHDSSETKIIILSISCLIMGYLLYWFTNSYLVSLEYNILIISYIMACFMILINDISNIKTVLIYKAEDDYLFSLPISSSHIILSKLFNIYIKNLIYIFIIMFPMYYVCQNVVKITDTGSFVCILTGLTMPLIPIIIGSIYAFIDYYYSRSKHKVKYNIIRAIITILIMSLVIFLCYDIKDYNINSIIKRLYYLNPFIYLFKEALINNYFLHIFLLLSIPIFMFYLFISHLSVNYTYLLSKIRGVKLSNNKKITIAKKKPRLFSMIHKEIKTFLNNKVYLRNSIYISVIFTISFLFISLFINTKKISHIHNIGIYLMLLISFIVGCICTTVNSLSLEKDNIIYYKCLPIKYYKVLLSKYITNIIIALPIIIINLLITILFYDLKKIDILFIFINPLILASFISLLGLILDYRFINYKNPNSNNIIKNRIVSYIPLIVNMIDISILFLINPIDNYYILQGTFIIFNILLILLLLFYLLIFYKRIFNTNIK